MHLQWEYAYLTDNNHRLRGSASPVLTATHHSYGSLAWLSDFFPPQPWRSDSSTDFHAKWLKRRGFTQWCAFCSKNRNFSYPLISRAPKRSKFGKCLDLEIFPSIWPRENTPYSSSELSKTDIVNRQSGGEKLKYILKFYIGVRVTWYVKVVTPICFVPSISETTENRDLVTMEHL